LTPKPKATIILVCYYETYTKQPYLAENYSLATSIADRKSAGGKEWLVAA
jgi:hypothetical protein